MFSLLVLAVSSFLLAYLLTPVVRELALQVGWVDQPDGHRRLHGRPVARVGGIAIFASFVGALGILMLFPLQGGIVLRSGWSMAQTVLPGIILIFAVGLLDDIVELRPWQKLTGQLAAAGLAIWGGVRLTGVFSHELDPWLSIPATVLWLVACTNAFNLIDGVDGLAAGTGAFATLTILTGALMSDNFELALLAVPLLGSVLGFLRYNFDPATIFQGLGSLAIGFMLGCLGRCGRNRHDSRDDGADHGLALPLIDTSVAIGRRFRRTSRSSAGTAITFTTGCCGRA